MSEEIDRNVETEYVKYCEEWFGVRVEPNKQNVLVPQWKMYRIANSHRFYRGNYYFFFVLAIIFIFMFMWSGVNP